MPFEAPPPLLPNRAANHTLGTDELFAARVLCAVILATYLVSFLLPVLPTFPMYLPGINTFWICMKGGYVAPRTGETTVFELSGFLLVGWLPNPLLWCGLLLLVKRRYVAANVIGLLALLLCEGWAAVIGLLLSPYWTSHAPAEWLALVPAHWDGQLEVWLRRRGLGIGYYTWMASICMLALSSTIIRFWRARCSRASQSAATLT